MEGEGILRGGDKDTMLGGAGVLAGVRAGVRSDEASLGDMTLDSPDNGVSGIGDDPPTDTSLTRRRGATTDGGPGWMMIGARGPGCGGCGCGLLKKSDRSLSSSSMRFI
jgi:hypothetical protein